PKATIDEDAASDSRPALELPAAPSEGDNGAPLADQPVETALRSAPPKAGECTSARIERDPSNSNRVTSTADAQGNVTRYGYDEQGQLDLVEYPEGSFVRRDDRGKWTSHRGDSVFPIKDSLSLDQETATLRFRKSNGDFETLFPDRSRSMQTKDGRCWTVNPEGQVVWTQDIHGVGTDYKYANGELVAVKRDGGFSASRDSSGQWVVTDHGVSKPIDGQIDLDTGGATGPELNENLRDRTVIHGLDGTRLSGDGQTVVVHDS